MINELVTNLKNSIVPPFTNITIEGTCHECDNWYPLDKNNNVPAHKILEPPTRKILGLIPCKETGLSRPRLVRAVYTQPINKD